MSQSDDVKALTESATDVRVGSGERASAGNHPCPTCGQPDRATSQAGGGPTGGERRHVAVLFADLQGFTAICEHSDPEDVIDLLNMIYDRLLAVAQAQGGHLDKILGDGIMLLFGAPRAHEDDALRAVRVALAMQDAMEEMESLVKERVGMGVKLRVGISSGRVIWGTVGPGSRAGPTVIGDAVNVAARLQHEAPPGGIVVDGGIYEATKRAVQYRTRPPVTLHGRTDRVPYYEVYGLSSRVTERETGASLRGPFVNRERELTALTRAWVNATGGLPQVALVWGEVGIGKSRLLREFLRSVRDTELSQAVQVLETSADQYHSLTYEPMVDLLRKSLGVEQGEHHAASRIKIHRRLRDLHFAADDMVPLLGYMFGWGAADTRLQYTDPQQLRQHVFAETTRILLAQAREQPTIMVVDDWQDASPDSLEMVNGFLNELIPFLEGQASPLPLMFVLVSRPGSQLSALQRPRKSFLSLSVKPLNQRDSTRLVEELAGSALVSKELITSLVLKAGGNPFYLVEGARSLATLAKKYRIKGRDKLDAEAGASVIPDSIQGLITARIDSLSPEARTVLQYAAVIGLHFRFDMLEALSPPAETLENAMAELDAGRLVRRVADEEGGQLYRFVDDVVREVAYGMLLRKTRQRLHEQIAHLAEEDTEQAIDRQEIKTLAQHYLASGNLSKAAQYTTRAGMMALAFFAYEEARTYLDRALDLLKQGDASRSELLRVQEALADACTFTQRLDSALHLYRSCLEIAETPEQKLALFYKIGRAHFYLADPHQAYANYQKAALLVPDGEDTDSWAARIEADIALLFDRV